MCSYYFLRLTMIYAFAKNFFLFALAFYAFIVLSNYKFTISICMQTTLSSFLLAIIVSTIYNALFTITFPLTLVLYVLMLLMISYKQLCFSFIYAITSICISYVILSVTAIPITFMYYLTFDKAFPKFIPFITLTTNALSTVIIILLLKNKRLKKTLRLLCNYNNAYIYILITFCITLIIIIGQAKIQDPKIIRICLIILTIFVVLLLYIIQRETQKYYLAKLKKLELESLRQELAEKDLLIQKLQESNDNLAHIIHKDNKLIPSMESAVQRYLLTADTLDTAALHETGTALAAELAQLAQSRHGILTSYKDLKDGLPHTGYAAIDAILSHMNDRAHAQHTDYNVTFSADFANYINQLIPEADLTQLLADLIENALIAVSDSGSRKNRTVLIHLGTLYDAPVVEVSDSGSPFAPAVYQDFGLQKHSTHLDNGGSGIGLMDIWELKKKYAASLHIHEYAPDTAPFAKKISIVFDKRNHYLIRTYRPQELLLYRTRTDMFVLPLE